jgi:hypothetical protein
VTLSYNIGFVGVREDSSDGAASVVLDMLLKFWALVYNQDETWAVHCFANCVGHIALAAGKQSKIDWHLSTS